MDLRKAFGAAAALLTLSAWPANASYLVEGSWGAHWQSYECGTGTSVWTCSYYFDTYTYAAGEQCVEVSVAADGSTEQRLTCHATMYLTNVRIQPRVNGAGRRVGCLSDGYGTGKLSYRSSVPALTHDAIPVIVHVHDGAVRVVGNFTEDRVPSRSYFVDVSYTAGCAAGRSGSGDTAAIGVVKVDA